MMTKTIWYAKKGSDVSCIKSAVIMASATGSIGSTQEEQDGKGNTIKTATVRKEGFQSEAFYKIEEDFFK